ncbi:hypothetical protein J1605_005228 [Eschrichtius robustus]|uniref:Uncharacterized protein n=1 Tax=Eschrichtius robustus TaxID=9764 RepID=A0AB34HBC4_ESCRO|nr:hypothetical protein J1605_005228 [Eschrichtius robustus]
MHFRGAAGAASSSPRQPRRRSAGSSAASPLGGGSDFPQPPPAFLGRAFPLGPDAPGWPRSRGPKQPGRERGAPMCFSSP